MLLASAQYSKSSPIRNSYLWVMLAQFLIGAVSSYKKNKKIPSNAGCSFLYVRFLIVGTFCMDKQNTSCLATGVKNILFRNGFGYAWIHQEVEFLKSFVQRI